MAESENHLLQFPLDNAWSDFYVAEAPPPKPSGSSGGRQRQQRAHAPSLHRWQSFVEETNIALRIKHDKTNGWLSLCRVTNANIKLSIEGGSEMPLLKVSLICTHKTGDVKLYAYFTAWSDKGFDMQRPRPPITPGQEIEPPPGSQLLNFSSRLMAVRVSNIIIGDVHRDTGFASGREGLFITFKTAEVPHCVNFQTKYDHLESNQRKLVEQFKIIRATEMEVACITDNRKNIRRNWAYLAAMPTPTPCPYSRYDGRWNHGIQQLSRIRFDQIEALDERSDNLTTYHKHFLKRKDDWLRNYPSLIITAADRAVIPMHYQVPYFLNARQYETVRVVGSIREVQYQERNAANLWNRSHTFDLLPLQFIRSDVTAKSQNDFLLKLNVRPMVEIPDKDLTPPQPGSSVRIRLKADRLAGLAAKHFEWQGVVVPNSVPTSSEFDIWIFVCPTERIGQATILNNLEADFHFGVFRPPYIQAQKAVCYAMYGEDFYHIPSDNWIKRLLLAHDNQGLANAQGRSSVAMPPNQPRYHPRRGTQFPLNSEQQNALIRCLEHGPADAHKVNIIVAGPGTGKTSVSQALVYSCYQSNSKLLVSSGSNYALDNAAERAFAILKLPSNARIPGVYRLSTEFDEHFSQIHRNGDDYFVAASEFEYAHLPQALRNTGVFDAHANFQEQDFLRVREWIVKRIITNRPFSLGDHMIDRVRKAMKQGSAWTRDWPGAEEEYAILWHFIGLRVLAQRVGVTFTDIAGDGATEDSVTRLEASSQTTHQEIRKYRAEISKAAARVWRDLQRFYLRWAKVIFVTASTAGRSCMLGFRPEYILIEEAGQLRESETLNAFVRSYRSAKTITLSGDPKQLPPTVTSSRANEFVEAESRSLMERWLDSGITPIRLNMQFRMHPDISEFPNRRFYQGTLINDASVMRRPASQIFKQWTRSFGSKSAINGTTSLFVNVTNGQVWQRRGQTSYVNPQGMEAIIRILRSLQRGCALMKEVTILCFYAAEQLWLKRWIHVMLGAENAEFKDVEILSVDASQGRQSEYVILSVCRTGESGMGFLTDMKRMNVSLTRAQDGLIIVGHAGLGKGSDSQAMATWKSLYSHHQNKGTSINMEGDLNQVQKVLNICTGNDWRSL